MSQNTNKLDLNNITESFKQLAQYVDKALAKITPYLQALKNGFAQANKSAQELGRSIKNMVQLGDFGDKIAQNCKKAMAQLDGLGDKIAQNCKKAMVQLDGLGGKIEQNCKKAMVQLDGLGDKIEQNCKKAMVQLDGLGDKIEQNCKKATAKTKGFFAKGMSDLMKFLTPLASGAIVSKALTTYIDGAKELEEAAKKAGQTVQEYQASQGLATYTEQDIELSKEWTKNQEELAVSLESINAVIMRMVMPAVNTMAQGIKKFISYIQENENDVKAFFIVLGVFALALGAKMALAFAPMIVVAAGIGAAIAAISYFLSDLFTYLDTGESKLSTFWSIFGTGEEISANLAKAWEILKAVGLALWDTLQARIDAFFTAFGPLIDGVKTMFSGLWTFLEGLFTLDIEKMGEGIFTYFKGLGDAVRSLFTGMLDFLWTVLDDLLGGIMSGAKKLLSVIPGFGGGDDQEGESEGFFASGAKTIGGFFGWGSNEEAAAMGVSPADAIAVNTPNYNQSAQTNNIQNTQSTNVNAVNVYTNATDANGIARDMDAAIGNQSRHMVMAANMGAMK